MTGQPTPTTAKLKTQSRGKESKGFLLTSATAKILLNFKIFLSVLATTATVATNNHARCEAPSHPWVCNTF
jgi:hypothetical protein